MFPVQTVLESRFKNASIFGPRELHVVNENETTVEFNLHNQDDKDRIKLVNPDDAIGIIWMVPAVRSWLIQYYDSYTGLMMISNSAFANKEMAIHELVNLYKTMQYFGEKEDPESKLEFMMKKHNWDYMFAKNESVFRAGKRQHDQIIDLIAIVNPMSVRQLWIKYAPQDVKCPF